MPEVVQQQIKDINNMTGIMDEAHKSVSMSLVVSAFDMSIIESQLITM